MLRRILTCMCGLSIGCGFAHGGTTYYVNDNPLGPIYDGSTWDYAFLSLQEALLNPSLTSGDDIQVAEGTYKPHASDRTVSFALKSGVTLRGGYDDDDQTWNPADNPTILSGDLLGNDGTPWTGYMDNSYHVVYFGYPQTGTAVIDGFIIKSGYAVLGTGTDNKGAGMYTTLSPTITNCTFQTSEAEEEGGGLYCNGGAPVITDCTFVGHSAGNDGGGLYIGGEAQGSLTDCLFAANRASGNGGGMQCGSDSSVTVMDCIFTANEAGYYPIGGGRRSLSHGGAIYILVADLTATNCLFKDNKASYNGGAMGLGGNPSHTVSLKNCTIYGNQTDMFGWGTGHGGGLYLQDSINVVNCILYNNQDVDGIDESAQIHVQSGTASVTYSCIQDDDPEDGYIPFGGAANNNDDDDPMFVNPPGNLHLDGDPCDFSPCINEGNNSAIPGVDTDLDDNPRIVEIIVDMGCFEYQDELGLCCPDIDNPPVCYGDANGSGTVDSIDKGLIKAAYGTTSDENLCRYDLNCDGTINSLDAGLCAAAYGQCTPESQEPCYMDD